jgi:hypothetical protein
MSATKSSTAREGRDPEPSAGLIDSQSVKGADTVGRNSRGYDAGTKINGRKRFIVTDTLGLLLVVVVLAASTQDRDGAKPVLLDASLRTRFADGGFAGRLLEWANQILRSTIEIVRKPAGQQGFAVIPRRWAVERTQACMPACAPCAPRPARNAVHPRLQSLAHIRHVPGAGVRLRPRRPQPAGEDLRAPADRFRSGPRRHRNGTVEPPAVPGEHLRMGPVIFAAGVAAAIYAATPVLAVTFASAAWGTCVALFSPPSRTLLLQQTPAEIHGRVRSQQPRSAPARAGVSRPRRHWHAGEPYRVRRPPGGRRARCRGRLLAKPGSRER